MKHWIHTWSELSHVHTTILDYPMASIVNGVRWVHSTNGCAVVAIRSQSRAPARPENRMTPLRDWLGEIPVTCRALPFSVLREWCDKPSKAECVRRIADMDVGWIDRVPFDRRLVRHAIKHLKARKILAWWDNYDNGPLLFAAWNDSWRIAVMSLAPDGQPDFLPNSDKRVPWPSNAPRMMTRKP